LIYENIPISESLFDTVNAVLCTQNNILIYSMLTYVYYVSVQICHVYIRGSNKPMSADRRPQMDSPQSARVGSPAIYW